MTLAQRKRIELEQKLDSLKNEFEDWRKNSAPAQPGKAPRPLEKHYTQIRRVTYQMEGLEEEIRKQLHNLQGDDDQVLAQCRQMETTVLELHRVWDFFRSKLVLRSIDWFGPYLIAADEFAWACYEAAQQKVAEKYTPKEKVKEPPLVFFNGGTSPFTLPRDRAFEAEVVPGERLKNASAVKALRSLPIPVIGIPWFQVMHLPDALVIGHEVGHDVMDDFGLTERVKTLLTQAMTSANIPEDHQRAWQAWSSEIFADVYGTLATGPAFVSSLIDFLAMGKTSIIADKQSDPNWGLYPTDYLRILICLYVLEVQGFKDEKKDIEESWKSVYSSHAMVEFEGDIRTVVEAINGPYPELSDNLLSSVISFSKSNQNLAVADSDRILTSKAMQGDNIRTLFAAARLAYASSPQDYMSKGGHQAILQRVPKIQKIGVRASKRAKAPIALEALDKYDKDAGKQLFDLLATTDPS